MILGNLNHPSAFEKGLLRTYPFLNDVFVWGRQALGSIPSVDTYFVGEGIKAIVQSVEPKMREDLVSFEAHVKNVDFQLCLSGSENIDWAPVQVLHLKQAYDPDKDYALYDAPWGAAPILMVPGTYVMFFPEDAHMPGILAWHGLLCKVVFKIETRLFQENFK